MTTAIEQLEAMRGLGENWDGYGGAAPRPDVIDLAQAFVGFLEAAVRRKSAPEGAPLHVSPTRIGGALVEWEDGSMEHEVEFDPDGSVGFLHLDKKTRQIETLDVHATRKRLTLLFQFLAEPPATGSDV